MGDTVKVHYTGRLEDGKVFDSSEGHGPLEFKIGAGSVIPGFESTVVGMSPGDSKQEKIPADQAYGLHRKELVTKVDRKDIPSELDISLAQQLQVKHPDGQVVRVTVADVSESTVTLDANHPLAGKDLLFQIELVEILSG
jgi:peptidylprolyl isomerase